MKTLYGILILTFWLFAACAISQRPYDPVKDRGTVRDPNRWTPMGTRVEWTLAQRLEQLQALDSAQIHEVLRLGHCYDELSKLRRIFGDDLPKIPYTILIDTLRKTDTLYLVSRLSVGISNYQELYGNTNPANPYEYVSKTGHYTYITKDCKCGSTKLYGDVQVVNSGGWFKVKISNPATLDVRRVTGKPSRCGDWRFVHNGADFTIQFVDENEDFTIRFVN